MKSKSFLLVKGTIAIVIALLMLLLPATFGGWFGMELEPAGVLMARFFGALMAGIALVCYFTSGAPASELRKNMILSLFVTDTLGFVLALIGQIQGIFNALGWILAALWLVLALFLGYFYFLKPED
jgi:hypothetical protein